MKPTRCSRWAGLVLSVALPLVATASVQAEMQILTPGGASPLESFAAREAARYFYLRTGALPAISESDKAAAGAIIIARKDRPAVISVPEINAAAKDLQPQQYILKTLTTEDGIALWIVGGDDTGTLYGAYRFVEKLGVRFYLHGDVIPDTRIKADLPTLDETGKPLFEIRGIQPRHFAEGSDLWNREDYLTYIQQLAKLRMNFVGFHSFPRKAGEPEPGVWIGLERDVDSKGRVRYSSQNWPNTMVPVRWASEPMKTSDFCAGAAQLFADDAFGSDVQGDMLPEAGTLKEHNRVSNNAGDMYHAAFAQARALGVKTCVGNETPLTIPEPIQEHLRKLGKDPQDPKVVQEVYQGIFTRIARAYPVDYYWLWTPEPWTWRGNTPEEYQATLADIRSALAALKELGDPFTLGTSGWVLGPKHDRTALDRDLPRNMPISCISRIVGHVTIEPGFAAITGRPKWAIPWMENDPNLVAPQPWVGRMRYDAATALNYGCTGLLGIHWRTKIMAMNVATLAEAGWDQSWTPENFKPEKPVEDPRDTAIGFRPAKRGGSNRVRTMPGVDAFYDDFARASFGEEIGAAAGTILARIDGVTLDDPSRWIGGPGGIIPNPVPWSSVKQDYAFVDELAALRPAIKSGGNLERFDYWLNTYRYMATMAELGCLRGELDTAMLKIAVQKNSGGEITWTGEAIRTRIALARAWERMITFQIAATDTTGEMGTLSNLEQHNRHILQFLEIHDKELVSALGKPLPEEVQLSTAYAGPARIIVPAGRTMARPGERVTLKVILMSSDGKASGELMWRPLGGGRFKKIPLKHVARGVFEAKLPKISTKAVGIEYFIRASADERTLLWPATAPDLCQTMISGMEF